MTQDGHTTTTDEERHTTPTSTSSSDDVIRWPTSIARERTEWVSLSPLY